MAARSLDKLDDLSKNIRKEAAEVKLDTVHLDLNSFSSITKAASVICSATDHLDIAIFNAGIMATPPGQTEDGYELQFGTNYMGHALLMKLLLPVMELTATRNTDVRIILLSSGSHNRAPKGGIRFDSLKSNAEEMNTWTRYGQSKLANILRARQAAKVYPALKVVAVHPGIVNTGLGTHSTIIKVVKKLASPFILSVEDGAKNIIWAATSTEVISGEYYEPVGVANQGSFYAIDDELALKLWDWTEQELQQRQTQK